MTSYASSRKRSFAARKRGFGALVYLLPLSLFLLFVLVYPLADMVYLGALPQQDILAAGGADAVAARSLTWKHLTPENYLAVFTNPFFRSTLALSLSLSAAISVLSIVLCFGPAWL